MTDLYSDPSADYLPDGSEFVLEELTKLMDMLNTLEQLTPPMPSNAVSRIVQCA